MYYEGIMDIIIKILCVFGISDRHGKIAQVLWPKSMYIIYLIHIKFLNSIQYNLLALALSFCTEQAMPNLTSPRVCQFPEGAVASLAGLNKLLFWDLILVNQC